MIRASAGAGFVCSVLSLPFDNIKVKLYKMKPDSAGNYPYLGVLDCFKKSIKREGISGLWVGFNYFYMRQAPHAMIVNIYLIIDFIDPRLFAQY